VRQLAGASGGHTSDAQASRRAMAADSRRGSAELPPLPPPRPHPSRRPSSELPASRRASGELVHPALEDIDPSTRFLYTPHTITGLVIGARTAFTALVCCSMPRTCLARCLCPRCGKEGTLRGCGSCICALTERPSSPPALAPCARQQNTALMLAA